ncbi:hypothetical protein MKW98_030959 [Papaver atlanticum]|uniref:Uncharacterized protein n=1 Tax=Papaver atlanticum TaxID=357466 RepID=A0AAD4S6S1_9MAGN|nr:hypothetical protein MKW98_030959 [Papaver atlanticum]
MDHDNETYNCEIKLRKNPERRKEKVLIGCGAGFAGDRSMAALKLLQRVPRLDYLVLECLAERTLADRYQLMLSGGPGYDPNISVWMSLLLPLAVEKGTCLITNMGAVDPLGAQKEVLDVANRLSLSIVVAVAYEIAPPNSGLESSFHSIEGGVSTYLGAAPIVHCLEKYKPHVIITSRVADAALFLAPMVYELGWNWNDLKKLSQGSLAGHLLECGCQLTGGYFMHPGDKYRQMTFEQLSDLSLPFAEVSFDGNVWVGKAEGSGGAINFSTCAEQLLYEIADPSAYITPDVVIDVQNVSFSSLSIDRVLCTGAKPSDRFTTPSKLLQLMPKDVGWKGWGEISYGGYGCIERAKVAELMVRLWMEEVFPGVNNNIVSYIIGLDSLKATDKNDSTLRSRRDNKDIRLRMDGLFDRKEQAIHFVKEFTALYTNGPAGGGGISTGDKKEIVLEKKLVGRESVFWRTGAKQTKMAESCSRSEYLEKTRDINAASTWRIPSDCRSLLVQSPAMNPSLAPSGRKIPLYQIAHSRVGDKGNDMNFSIIPHFFPDIEKLKLIITPNWVKAVVACLEDSSSFPSKEEIEKRNKWVDDNVDVEIYEVKGIHSLNVVVRNILDGGVNCSRRIDRHGKTLSDLILCQQIVLPP